jgi:hypothetical protein
MASNSKTTESLGYVLLLLETLKAQSSRTIGSLSRLLLLLKSQSSRTPRGNGRLLLLLKINNSMTPWGKGHLHLLPKTFICILLQSNQSSYLALIERLINHFLLHNDWFMGLLRIVRLVAFFVSGQKVQNNDKNACRQMF